MRARPFQQVDVFSATPGLGNPLAVVLDGSDLDEDAMQRFARWTHLSETTFVLPPTPVARAAGADYRVRIFTPAGELPFAGHPTLGTCHAWLNAGGVPQSPEAIVQECAVGLVHVRQRGDLLAFAAPPLRRSAPPAQRLAEVTIALGLQPAQVLAAQWLDNGPFWLGLLLDSPDTVLGLQPDHARLRAAGEKVGVAARYEAAPAVQLIARSSREARAFAHHGQAQPAEPDLEVRAFAAAMGVDEDPVTGSLNASLAQWLIEEGRMPPRYLAAQGTCLDRAGRVHIERDPSGQVWVGGEVARCIEGQVRL
ncbi:MAG: PhzF family phenazine biosynthesis protein [Burkholderiaceae bacterium]|nr:PhzF family phenazine biosynthesis protein [Burkholderiaceae bacterium]